MWHNVSIDDFQKRGQCYKRMSSSIPIRYSAIHFCLPHENRQLESSSSQSKSTRTRTRTTSATPNPQLLRLLKAMFVMSIGAELRPHLRVHIGSIVECMYALQSFGILSEQIPVNTTTGKVKTKQHLKWLELMLQKEKAINQNRAFNKIECPMIKDVLFGRGWPIMKHPGNVILRGIIDSKLEEYKNEKSKRAKTLISYSVVCSVKQKGHGGRFLKEDSGWWVEVSNDAARQKVSIAFRDARKLKSNNSNDIKNITNANANAKPTNTTTAISSSKCSSCSSDAATTKRKEADMNSGIISTSTAVSDKPPSLLLSALSSSSQLQQKHLQEQYYQQQQQQRRQQNDSSTSAFLGMDGCTSIKRQRCWGQ